MTFITRTFEQFDPSEINTLSTTPPTDESREIAGKVGRMMGEFAYPGDMVLESVAYEAGQLGWSQEITALVGNLAFQGMQRG